MKFAHSLGYPHYDLLLDDLTATQYVELQYFFSMEKEKKEEIQAKNDESNILRFFTRAEIIQKKMKEDG
jgi:hypothetical protein